MTRTENEFVGHAGLILENIVELVLQTFNICKPSIRRKSS